MSYIEYQERRIESGKVNIRFATKQDLERSKTAYTKVALSDALVENIFYDYEHGSGGGSYYLDGQRAERGYAVGGYEGGYRKAEELRVSPEELTDKENVYAAIVLMDEEIRTLQSGGDVIIGWWMKDGWICFDVSNIYADKNEAFEVATSRQEEAIYDLYTDEEIQTEFYVE